MRLRTLRRTAWAAWLGVVALVINALVPIHVAFDVADAVAAHRKAAGAADHGREWRLFALVTGHDEADGKSGDRGDDDHHHADCAVCSALGALGGFGGFAPAAAAALSVPLGIEAPTLLAAIANEPDGAPAAAYRSRAPPLG